jgi:hypothetical protein
MCLPGDSNTILIAINCPNNIDPLLQTGCFSSVVSSSIHTIAPAPHGLEQRNRKSKVEI